MIGRGRPVPRRAGVFHAKGMRTPCIAFSRMLDTLQCIPWCQIRVIVLSYHVVLFRQSRRTHTRVRMRTTTLQSLSTCCVCAYMHVLFHACIFMSATVCILTVCISGHSSSSSCGCSQPSSFNTCGLNRLPSSAKQYHHHHLCAATSSLHSSTVA